MMANVFTIPEGGELNEKGISRKVAEFLPVTLSVSSLLVDACQLTLFLQLVVILKRGARKRTLLFLPLDSELCILSF